MSNSDLLAEKRTELAEKRTELAQERTIAAYVRTAVTVFLFGVAFMGLSKEHGDFFFYASIGSLVIGTLFGVQAALRSFKHSKELNKIKEFFGKRIKSGFSKEKEI